jgi:23S rRNA pseudouridine1911/1915/1917 synthase
MDRSDGQPALELLVAAGDEGQRLDQYLAEPLGSRTQAARAITTGRVSVNGRPPSKRTLVTAGDAVIVQAEPVTRSPASGPATAAFTIVYEDSDLLVVDKPAGVVVHPARGHQQGTLAQALADRAAGGEDPERAGIVHRLDKDTSGLLVVAKSAQVHRLLKALISSRELHREYLALVDGIPPARTGTIDAPIGRDRRDRLLISLTSDHPREARTHFELVEALGGAALLRVTLETGRTHQIRVHMSAIGHPVVGDRSYGGTVRFGLKRQFLHAARLSFVHPISGKPIDVTSPLPADLESALQLARAAG